MSKVYKNKILTTAGFDLPAATPLDDRLVVQTIEDLTTELVDKNVAYEGMRVYVTEEKLDYQYIDGVWVKSTSGIPLTSTMYENSMQTPEFEDGTQSNALGRSTTAIGYGVTAGALSWRITSRSMTEEYTELRVYDPEHRLSAACENKQVGVRFNNNYDYCGVLHNFYGHDDNIAVIAVVPAIPLEELDDSVGIEDTTSDKNTLKIYDLPQLGYIHTGTYSFAEGYAAQAQGMISHAEGYNTKAIGKYSHAEGHSTIAAYSAHSEGNRTKAIGWNSHAEGASTQAIGNASHAEGESTIASGQASHAEGNGSQASEYCTHASGAGTRATERCQFVQGRFNTIDANGSAGNFAHIVGGGSSDSSRKNIYTLDWNGNAVFAGNVRGADGKTLTSNDFTTAEKTKLSKLPTPGQEGAIAFGIGTSATLKGAFAEGHYCQAKGWASHAEGNTTTAVAGESHAEGSNTSAEAQGAHAEGIGTRATVAAQHAEGKYNATGNYAHIVGNGKSANERSNAYTLDWSGNAWFAGSISAPNNVINTAVVKLSGKAGNQQALLSVESPDNSTYITAGEIELGGNVDVHIDSYGISLGDIRLDRVTGAMRTKSINVTDDIVCEGNVLAADLEVGADLVCYGTTQSNTFQIIDNDIKHTVTGDTDGVYIDNKRVILEGDVSIKVGNTELNEDQLKKLLALIEPV